MHKIAGKVLSQVGTFVAESKEGTLRTLKKGDIIYEGDAIYQTPEESVEKANHQNENGESPSIIVQFNNGLVKRLTGVGYLVLDEALIGEDQAVVSNSSSIDAEYKEELLLNGARGIFDQEVLPNNIRRIPSIDTTPRDILDKRPKEPIRYDSDEPRPPFVNDIPVAVEDFLSIKENEFSKSGNLILNDLLGEEARSDGHHIIDLFRGTDLANFGSSLWENSKSQCIGSYGKLVVDTDGSYTYFLDNGNPKVNGLGTGESLTETFSYTIADSDGDRSTATLTITIDGQDDGTPAINLTPATLNEGSLPNGTEAGSSPNSTSGVISFTSPDGFVPGSTIKISGVELTYEDITNLSSSSKKIVTEHGEIELKGFDETTNEISYTYILTKNLDHSDSDSKNEVIPIEVKDGNGSGQTSGISNLIITINDDSPIAVDDSASITEGKSSLEDSVLSKDATAGLLSNDKLGADSVSSGNSITGVESGKTPAGSHADGNVGSEVSGLYGKITVNADGSYSYNLDNKNPAIDSLGDGETLTEVFTYTITDSDGDRSTATLTITINGKDDGTPGITAADTSVYEKGLADGSESSSGAEITSGTFSFTAPDGFVEGSILKVGGTELTYSEVVNLGTTNKPINATHGTIVLNGFNADTNEVSYTYTLTESIDHSDSAPDNEVIAIGVKDGSGSGQATGSGSLTINIINDTPTAVDDSVSITEGQNTAIGTLLTVSKADGVLKNDTFGADRVENGEYVTGVESGNTSGSQPDGNVGEEIAGAYGKLTLNGDGSYSYILNNVNSEVNSLGNGQSLTDSFTYTITDSDGDKSTATLAITINGQDDGTPSIAANNNSVYEKGLADGSASSSGAEITSGIFSFTAPDGFVEGSILKVGGTELTYSEVVNLGTTNKPINTTHGTLVLNGFNADTNEVSYTYTLAESIDHSDSAPDNEVIAIEVKDGSGSGQATGVGSLTISIVDDVPVANGDSGYIAKDGTFPLEPFDGVLANDLLGADGASVSQITKGSSTQNVTESGVSITGTYGTLTIKADGSYTYTPDLANTEVKGLGGCEMPLNDVFNYTITDGDGSTATSTLTIKVVGKDGGVPVLTLPTANSVSESGIASIGSNPGSSATVSDKFSFTTPDSFVSGSTVKINGTELTYDDIINLASTNKTVETTYGEITLNAFNPLTNEISYTYTLTKAASHDSASMPKDSISIEVQDGNGICSELGPGEGTLEISIADDSPEAVNDTLTVEENSTGNGNVIANDKLGSDRVSSGSYVIGVAGGVLPNASGNVGSELAGTYGKITLNANGTYEYTPDNSNPAVNSLGNGQSLTDSFTYTIIDSDGDKSTATLTITINGQDDGTPSITAADTSVYEKGLADGSASGSDTEITSGTFSFTAPDGFVEGSTLNVGGTGLTYSEVVNLATTNKTINTTHGTLVLNGFNADTNEVSYTYTLAESIDHSDSTPDNEVIAVEVKDGSGSGQATGSGSLTISIVNDTPTADDDSASIKEGQDTIADSVLSKTAAEGVLNNDTFGADKISSGNYVTGVKSGTVTAGTHTSGHVGEWVEGAYGKITLNADGSYTYKLDNTNPVINALKNGDTKTEVFSYTIEDSDGDKSTATLTITIDGTNDTPIASAVTASGDKDSGYGYKDPIEITLSATDVDTPVSHFKLTSLPDVKDGKLYTDSSCTNEVSIDTDYAATSNKLKLYFKPNYSDDKAQSNFGPNWAESNSITFTVAAKDSSSSDGVSYSNNATVTVDINDLPHANPAAEKSVVENNFNSTANSVAGNVIADGTGYDSGKDYYGNDTGVNIYQIRYIGSDGNYGSLKTLTSGDNTYETDYGTLVINRETGDYTFTPKSSLNNPSGADIAFKFEYSIVEKNNSEDISNLAEQIIKIEDGPAPATGVIATKTVHEKNLPTGTDPLPAQLSTTESLAITAGSDRATASFDSVQTALNDLFNNPDSTKKLTSLGRDLSYEISPDGSLLTAKAGSETVFTVRINNPTFNGTGGLVSDTSYTFTLKTALDHKTALLDSDGDIALDFGFTVKDLDDPLNDRASSTFKVKIADDHSPNKSITTNEDVARSFNTNADATGSNTFIGTGTGYADNKPSYGTAVVNSDGTITYTPNANYSGTDSFKYTTTLDDGSVQEASVTVTVNPVSDAPTLEADKTLTTNEDEAVALNLIKPVIADNVDLNGTNLGDNPERLGIIEISGLPDGAVITKNDGTIIFTGNSGQVLKVHITDDANLHYNGLDTSGVIGLTTAEYEGLKIKGAENSHRNIDLKVKAVEYEVDDSSNKLVGVEGASSVQNVKIDVLAVTDPVSLNWTSEIANVLHPSVTIKEDKWVRIDSLLTPNLGDTDGSEEFMYVLDKSQLAGWRYREDSTGNGTEISGSGRIEFKFSGNNPPRIELLPPSSSSLDQHNITIKLEALDSDDDSTSANPQVESAELNLEVIVIEPIANDMKVIGTALGDEDTHIKLEFTPSCSDPDEYISGIEISALPAGVKLYEKNGGSYVELTLTDGKWKVEGQTKAYMEDLLDRLYVLPDKDDNNDFQIKFKIQSTDVDEDSPNNAATNDVAWSSDNSLKVKVLGVVDLSDSSDVGGAGRLYTEIYGTQTLPGGTPAEEMNEDGIIDLKLGFESYENKHNSTTDNSEKGKETYFVIRSQEGENTPFRICDSSGNILGERTADGGWKLTVGQLSQAHLKPESNYDGTLKLELLSHVQDMGDDSKAEQRFFEQVDKFQILVKPVADLPLLQIREVFTPEDKPVRLIIEPYTADFDGSEYIKQVKISDIPYGAVIKHRIETAPGKFEYVDVFVNNDTGKGLSEYTFVVDSSPNPSTDYGNSVSNSTHSGKLNIEHIKELYIQPPAHSSEDFEIKLTPVIAEKSDPTNESSAEGVLTVHIRGKADVPIIKLVDRSPSDDFGVRTELEGEITNETVWDGRNVTIGENGEEIISESSNPVTFYGLERTDGSSLRIPLGFSSESGENKAITLSTNPEFAMEKLVGDNSETLSYVLKNLPSHIKLVDSAGKEVGTLISMDNVNQVADWAIDASKLEGEGVFFEAPIGWSGKVTGLKLLTIAQENDGHTIDRLVMPMPFNLEIKPVVNAELESYSVSGLEDAAPSAEGELGTMIPVTFGIDKMTDKSESVSEVRIAIDKVHEGLDLYAKEGDTWIKVDGNPNYIDGDYYRFSGEQVKDGVAIAVDPNGSLYNCHIEDDSVQLKDVIVSVKDISKVEGSNLTVTKDLTIDITVKLEGVADKPVINSFTGVESGNRTFDLTVDALFPDQQPTPESNHEIQYFIIEILKDGSLQSGWSFNKGTNYGNGLSAFTKEEILSGVKAVALNTVAEGNYEMKLTAVAIEGKTMEQTSKTIGLTVAPPQGAGPIKLASVPTLQLLTPELNEDTYVTLDKIIDCDNTHTNDADDGDEQLSFVIDNLTEGFELESDSVSIVRSVDPSGKTFYCINVGGNSSAAELKSIFGAIRLVPPQDFSGHIPNFGITAFATEKSSGDSKSARVEATADILPIADEYVLVNDDGTPLVLTTDEDVKLPLKLGIQSNDIYSDHNDLPESFKNIKISIADGQGCFVDENGNKLGTSTGGVTQLNVTMAADGQLYLGSKKVHYLSDPYASGTFEFNLSVDSEDKTIIGGVTKTDTKTQLETVKIEVVPVPNNPADSHFSVDTVNPSGSANHGIYTTDEGEAVALNLAADFADNDSSEFHTLLIRNVPIGSRFIDNNGKTVGSNNGDGTWSFTPGELVSLNGLKFLPAPHKSGEIHLELYGAATEKGNGGVSEKALDFRIHINPKADGVVITPKLSGGSWSKPAKVVLEASLVEQDDYNSHPLKDENGNSFISDEVYKVVFTAESDDVNFQLYTLNEAGDMILLPDTDPSPRTFVAEQLTQYQVDHLYAGMESDLDGYSNFIVDVRSQETDGNGTVLDTSPDPGYRTILGIDFAQNTASVINGTEKGDVLYGHMGNQTINGKAGNDIIYGGIGNDYLYGGDGDDTIYGGGDDDYIDGGAGADRLYGGEGNDTFLFDSNDIVIDGGTTTSPGGSELDSLILKSGDNIDFSVLTTEIKNIEAIELGRGGAFGGDHHLSNLTVKDLVDMTDSHNVLYVKGDSGDSVTLTDGADSGNWNGTTYEQTVGGIVYDVYEGTFGGENATLYIQQGIQHSIG